MKASVKAKMIALLTAAGVAAQATPDVRALLASEDPTKREAAFHQLASQNPLTQEARTALVDLLARENAAVKAAFLAGPGASGTYGEGYGEYVGWLTEAVMKIADAEPDRTDVWNALLATSPGPGDSAYGRWLGTHGDKALPYLLRYAADQRTDDWDRMNRLDALKSLAQIAAYERRPEAAHDLSAADLQIVESLVRHGLGDADIGVRQATVVALEIIGDPQDLPALDEVAATDGYVVRNGGQSGTEIRFPIREYARGAAERVRAKLAAKTAPVKVP